jgi:transposase InsO family protein
MENQEIKLRQEAVKKCLEGKAPSQVAKEVKRSKAWVCKWLKRYKSDPTGNWFDEHSRRPHKIGGKTQCSVEEQILLLRRQLEQNKYSQQGALSIQYAFRQLNLTPPAIWTINRVLKRYNMIQEARKHKKIKPYPEHYISVQQVDFVGPRYIKNDGRFYSLNIIDIPTHIAGVYPSRTTSGEDALNGLVQFWKSFGIPDCIQLDNALSFRGSNKYPRSLNRFLRFVISQGVVPLFIPKGEPWRNGVIERFNDTFDKKFLRSQRFESFESLCREAPRFMDFHNTMHRYTCLQGKTPQQAFKDSALPSLQLPSDFQPTEKIALEGGCILFVFFLRSDCKIEVLGTKFKVNPVLQYSYITARLNINTHTLAIERDNEIFHVFPFVMTIDW